MPAVGITDHGNMHGAYELWRAAVDSGVKRSSASRRM